MPNIKQNAINPAVNEPLGQGILAHAGADISADMIVIVTSQFGAHLEVVPASQASAGDVIGNNNLYVARHSASAGEYVVILPWKTVQVTGASIDPGGKFGFGIFGPIYWNPNTDFYTSDLDAIYSWGPSAVIPVATIIDKGDVTLPVPNRIYTLQVNPSGGLSGRMGQAFFQRVTLPAGVTSLAWPMTGITPTLKDFINPDTHFIVASVREDDSGSSIGTLLSATLWPSAFGVYDTVQLRWEAAGTAGDAIVVVHCFWYMY